TGYSLIAQSGNRYEQGMFRLEHARALAQHAAESRRREYARRRVVGISLLTLVPGISGGSETYARELCRALARVGTLEYRVFVPGIATDAGDGLASQTVDGYRASRTMPGRIAAMSRATLNPEPLRRALELEHLNAI